MSSTTKKRLADCPHCHQFFLVGRQLSCHVSKCIQFGADEAIDSEEDDMRVNNQNALLIEEDDSEVVSHNNDGIVDDDDCVIDLPPDDGSGEFNAMEPDVSNMHAAVDFNNSQLSSGRSLTRDDVVHLSLLRMCHEINLPLYAYDNIMQWAQDSFRMGYTFPRSAPSRRIFLNDLYEMYDMKGCTPTVQSVDLIGNTTAEVVTFSFEQMIRSLLGDPELFVAENVLFPVNSESPIIPPHNGDDLGEIISGDWYKTAFNNLCTDPNDFLCPIVLFIDKTHVSEHARWTLEPVIFTLAVFNRSTRNLSKAWRPLGLVTDSNRKSSAQNSNTLKVNPPN
jgi:hypothetical protein